MSKGTLLKLVKAGAIVSGVYTLCDVCVRLGEGAMLGIMKHSDADANETYDTIVKGCDYSKTVKDKMVFKLIKFTADTEMKKLKD